MQWSDTCRPLGDTYNNKFLLPNFLPYPNPDLSSRWQRQENTGSKGSTKHKEQTLKKTNKQNTLTHTHTKQELNTKHMNEHNLDRISQN